MTRANFIPLTIESTGPFVREIFEEYLLGDLKRMEDAQGIGFPMLATAFAGIELLGFLLRPQQKCEACQKEKTCAHDFELGWLLLYPEPPAAAMANPIYTLFRHGIAHTFTPKGPVSATLGTPHAHLKFDSDRGWFHVDPYKLRLELKRAYLEKIFPCLDGSGQESPMLRQVHARLASLLQQYHQNSIASIEQLWVLVGGSAAAVPPLSASAVSAHADVAIVESARSSMVMRSEPKPR